jgi:hypothetical protein
MGQKVQSSSLLAADAVDSFDPGPYDLYLTNPMRVLE